MLKNHLSKLMGEKRYTIIEVSRKTGLPLKNYVNYLTVNQMIYLSIFQMRPKNSLIFQ